jgi:phosphatidylglycerol---prolipoprotein diacylglyceryl transferase
MFYHNLDNSLNLGFIEIKYYGMLFALGFVIAFFFIRKFHKYFNLKLTDNELVDYILYSTLGVIVGARLFYCFIYFPQYFLNNPIQIVFFWKGGLSFHGGIIGLIIAVFIYSKIYKKSFLALADVTSFPGAIALFFGRIGNFINGELIGRITNFPFCIRYEKVEGCRHFSQIYESLKNLIIFITLFYLKKKNLKNGTYSGIFLIMYSILRFFIEFVREPDKQIGYLTFGLTMGQWLNIFMFLFGVIFLLYLYKNEIHLKLKKMFK